MISQEMLHRYGFDHLQPHILDSKRHSALFGLPCFILLFILTLWTVAGIGLIGGIVLSLFISFAGTLVLFIPANVLYGKQEKPWREIVETTRNKLHQKHVCLQGEVEKYDKLIAFYQKDHTINEIYSFLEGEGYILCRYVSEEKVRVFFKKQIIGRRIAVFQKHREMYQSQLTVHDIKFSNFVRMLTVSDINSMQAAI